jgi:hypothetical protein
VNEILARDTVESIIDGRRGGMERRVALSHEVLRHRSARLEAELDLFRSIAEREDVTAATYTVPTIVVVLVLALPTCVAVGFVTDRIMRRLLDPLVARWERRMVEKRLTPEEQAQYWAEKEQR